MILSVVALATTPARFPFEYDWGRFPAAWFGANATDFENTTQLDAIGRYSLAIFGWQALITKTGWTAAIGAQLMQAKALKQRHPSLPVFVYQGFGNANGYDAPTFEIIRTASDGCPGHQPCRRVAEPYTDWVLEAEGTPVYSMSACEQMGNDAALALSARLADCAQGWGTPTPPRTSAGIPSGRPARARPAPPRRLMGFGRNVGNASMRDYFIEQLVGPIARSPDIDGVFYDCFNFAYSMPSPWNRHAVNIANCSGSSGGAGCEVLLNGTLDLAKRIAVELNRHGKIPIFSNPASFVNAARAPIWLDEARLVSALEGTAYIVNYEFYRAEQVATNHQLSNLVHESEMGIPVALHTYLKNATEDPTPHLAAFMLFRQPYWYSFSSTGWLDRDWAWSPVFDRLGGCGKPVEGPQGVPAPLVYSRRYERCSFTLNCSKQSCETSIVWPKPS